MVRTNCCIINVTSTVINYLRLGQKVYMHIFPHITLDLNKNDHQMGTKGEKDA